MAITDNKSLNKNLCNVPVGGLSVKPRTNQRNFFDFDNEEKQTYYKNHFVKQAWNSCASCERRY